MTNQQNRIEEGWKLVDDFDKAAQTWGWEKDQGHGSAVAVAEKAYDEALEKLNKFIRENTK